MLMIKFNTLNSARAAKAIYPGYYPARPYKMAIDILYRIRNKIDYGDGLN